MYARAVMLNTKPEILYPSSLEDPDVKTKGIENHGTARAIQSADSLLYCENKNIPNIHQEFVDDFLKKLFL